MTKKELIEIAVKLIGFYELIINATGSVLQILANTLEMKYASFSKSYYFMFLLSEIMIGWALILYSKSIAAWLDSFGNEK